MARVLLAPGVMSPSRSFITLTAVLGLLGSAGTASAQTAETCQTSADCQHGYTCQVSGYAGTGTAEPACPADVDCSTSGTGGSAARHDVTGNGTAVPTDGTGTAPNAGAGGSSGATPPADGGTGSSPADPGTSGPVLTCQPGPCSTDTDCAAGMVCHADLVTTCSGGEATPPCPAGTKCDTSGVTNPTCTTQSVSTCAFKWALPCNADADCGDGFACQPSLTVSCSGGSPTTGAGGETGGGTSGSPGAIELIADSCTSSTSYPGSCRPLAATCNTDADCPANWLCQDNFQVVSTPGSGGIAGAGGATASTSGGGGTSGSGNGVSSSGAADVAPPTYAKSCVAPYSSPQEPTRGAGGTSGGSPSSNPSTGGNDGTPPTGTGEGTASSGGSTGTSKPTAGTGTGGTTGTISVNGAADSKGASADNSGGCSVVPARGSASAGWLAGLGALGALLVARRRRLR